MSDDGPLKGFARSADNGVQKAYPQIRSNGASTWRSINLPSIFRLLQRQYLLQHQRLGWLSNC
jgi:hypothetical protein